MRQKSIFTEKECLLNVQGIFLNFSYTKPKTEVSTYFQKQKLYRTSPLYSTVKQKKINGIDLKKTNLTPLLMTLFKITVC